MPDEKKSNKFILGFIPRCPFYKPIPVLISLTFMAFGTWGIYYLNLWAAVGYLIYSLVFYFFIMPFTMCKHCYFRTKDTSVDKEQKDATEKLPSIEKWNKTLLHKHVGQKNWVWLMFLVWILPIILTIVSFFLDFDYLAIIALVGFIIMLVCNFLYLIKIKCPSCPIQEECHSSF